MGHPPAFRLVHPSGSGSAIRCVDTARHNMGRFPASCRQRCTDVHEEEQRRRKSQKLDLQRIRFCSVSCEICLDCWAEDVSVWGLLIEEQIIIIIIRRRRRKLFLCGLNFGFPPSRVSLLGFLFRQSRTYFCMKASGSEVNVHNCLKEEELAGESFFADSSVERGWVCC